MYKQEHTHTSLYGTCMVHVCIHCFYHFLHVCSLSQNISHFCPPAAACPPGSDLVTRSVTGECCPAYECNAHPPPIESLTPTLPPPIVISFRRDPDRPDMLSVTWRPISLDEHASVSLDGYYIEVSRDRNGSDIVATGTAAAGDTSFVLSVGESSDRYWVRIKAVNGTLDVSEFSDWFAISNPHPILVNGECGRSTLNS